MVQPYKRILKYPRYQDAFIPLGRSLDLNEETVKELELFTCVMYGYPRLVSVKSNEFMILYVLL